LTNDCVAFPSVAKKASDKTLLELEWKVSSIPSSYISSYGPPCIAAVGLTYSKSVAVASRNGLCVLDTRHNRYRWKQFGTPAEEKAFTIVSMVWWEGRYQNRKRDDENDDLLLGIIRTNTGHQYLSCWTSKRYVKTYVSESIFSINFILLSCICILFSV
jgi:hypothetical protein